MRNNPVKPVKPVKPCPICGLPMRQHGRTKPSVAYCQGHIIHKIIKADVERMAKLPLTGILSALESLTLTFTGRCKGCGVSIIRDRDFCDECLSRGDESPLPE